MVGALFIAVLGCVVVRSLYRQGCGAGVPELVMLPLSLLGLLAMFFGSLVMWWDQVRTDMVDSPTSLPLALATLPLIVVIIGVGAWLLLGTPRALAWLAVAIGLGAALGLVLRHARSRVHDAVS